MNAIMTCGALIRDLLSCKSTEKVLSLMVSYKVYLKQTRCTILEATLRVSRC